MTNKRSIKKRAKSYFVFTLFLVFLMSNKTIAQNLTLEGTVKDASGLTLPGVNIIEKGTKNSTSTDFDGKYTIKLTKQGAVLSFSFVGFKTKEIPTAGKTRLDVSLADDSNTLNEVVVVGYGTVKKSDLTGAVSTLSGAELRKNPVANIGEALTGRIAGVSVTSSEGSPDSEIKIRIRGGGSLTQDASPLIIVDGFPVNSINDISPSDIESQTVLKDASSTAIYGSRGANGVVIYTTKKGKNGKMSVNFNMYYGMKKMANEIDVLSTEDFVKWQYEYALLKKDVSTYEKYFGAWQDHDLYNGVKGDNWQKQIYGQTGEVQSRDLGIRGGSDKINYNFNYAHYDEKAIMVGSDFNRNNISLALNSKVSDKIDLSFTTRYSDTEINGGGTNEVKEVSSADARLRHAVGYAPIPLPGLTTDNTDEAISSYLVNPFVATADNDRQQLRKNFNMLGSFSWKLIDNLVFKSEFGLDNRNNQDYRFYGRSTYYVANIPAAANQGMPAMVITDQKNTTFRNANTLNYDFKKLLGSDHHLRLLAGQEMINTTSNTMTSTIHAYPKDFGFDQAQKLTSQGIAQSIDNFYSPDDKLLSFFGQANYDYKNKYLVTATYRGDGSSKFTTGNKWGYFPAGAIAWKISEENFLKNVDWISSLKIRASYGEAGNNNIPTGQTTQSFLSGNSTWINNSTSQWAPSKTLANPDLKWETTITQNLGLDFDFFKSRINGSLEMYKNKTQDLLILFPIAGVGYNNQYRNMGETQNTGYEATLNVAAIQREKYGLNFSFNIGVNKNNINSLGVMSDFYTSTNWASSQITNDYAVKVGSPIGIMYGYQNAGRYEVSDFTYDGTKYTLKTGVADATGIVGAVQPGYMKLKDLDGNGIIDSKDQTVIGDSNPKNTGGMVINANAYGFDLSAAFNWSYGNDIYNANKVEFTTSNPNGQYRNLTTEMADGQRWTNLDPVSGQLVTDPTALTALNANTTMWSPYMKQFVFNDWAVEDGSFLRLNTLTLGYTAPEFFNSKIGISKLRFYGTVSNVFVWTNYSGPDPEVNTRRATPLTPGVDYSAYPRSRQFVFGLNLNF
ncbi:TonB-linked SusC/RagA family outer membrane protein [Flavobacterium sp. 1]|uniref:SusC/RagA family TonB-linked outer membrane protein n=1 Tax=Flavobacterium sp. 1 TaxID=2035200 RepID=UPI000C24ECD2|nr:TonB-dependent receptor [Flavobacterium sp. 1]PJJ08815.1 TonB-linked SusC/RagA family outer membrane protein [Flavobacterium sp. 1]